LDRLSWQLPALQASGLDMVIGHAQLFEMKEQGGKMQQVMLTPPCFLTLLGCVLCHRRILEKVGYLDERLWQSEDVDWFLRCKDASQWNIVPKLALYYRIHANNMTRSNIQVRQSFFIKAVHHSILRRRKQNE